MSALRILYREDGMACRDYEFDYENWFQRAHQRFHEMTVMLADLCDHAVRHGVEVPTEIASWRRAVPLTAVVRDDSLSKAEFDALAQMLCTMCRRAEQASLTLSPETALWWANHKACDDHAAGLDAGLSPTPIYANFWQEHSARQKISAQFPGVSPDDAIRVLGSVGFQVAHEGRRHITISNGTQRLLIARDNPVNAYAMANFIQLAGLTDEQFREKLASPTIPK